MNNRKDKNMSKFKSVKVTPKIFPDDNNNSVQVVYLNSQNGKNVSDPSSNKTKNKQFLIGNSDSQNSKNASDESSNKTKNKQFLIGNLYFQNGKNFLFKYSKSNYIVFNVAVNRDRI